MPAAVPLIIAGVSAGTSLYNGYKARQGAKPQEALAAAQAAAAQQQMAQSGQLFQLGLPLVQAGSTYYSRLLRGDRAALRSAVSPEANEISETYAGAENALRRSNLTGAARDREMGELARERAGRISALVPLARRAAAGEVSNLGTALTSGGQQGLSNAGNAYASLLQGERENQRYKDEQSAAYGKQLGGLITDIYKAWPRGDGGGGASGSTYSTVIGSAFQ